MNRGGSSLESDASATDLPTRSADTTRDVDRFPDADHGRSPGNVGG